jgi:hypothetical protein
MCNCQRELTCVSAQPTGNKDSSAIGHSTLGSEDAMKFRDSNKAIRNLDTFARTLADSS